MATSVPTLRQGQFTGGHFRPTGVLTLSNDAYRRSIALVLIMTISRIHQNFNFLTPLRPALTLTMIAAAYAYMNPRLLATGNLTRTLPAKAIVGMFMAACLSVPFGISMGGSGRFILFEFIKTIVLALLIIAAIRDTRDLYTLVWAFVISSGALSYLSLFVFKMRKASDDGLLRIQNGYSYDSNDIATVAVVSLAVALLMFQVCRGRGKTVAGIVVAGLGATVAKTGSRGGFLGLMVFGIALLLMLKTVPVMKRVMFLVVTFIALSIAAPPGYWEQMKTIFSPTEDYNWTDPTGRKEVFKRGMGYMALNPITGIGVDNFPRAEGTLSDRARAQAVDKSLAGIKWSAAHNSFLEVASETGLVGLGCFLTLIVGSVVVIIKLRKKMPKQWERGTQEERFLYFSTIYLPVAFVTFCASGFFVSFGYIDLMYVLGALVAGLIVCVERKLREDARARSGPVSPAPIAPSGPRGAAPVIMPSLRFPQPPAGPSA